MSELPSTTQKPSRVAGATAAVVATGALACGACCVLPFALPAGVLAMSGGLLAWFGGLYRGATMIAIVAVVGGWAWIAWQTLRTRRRPARSTLATMIVATLVLAAALAWPRLEGPLLHLLRGS